MRSKIEDYNAVVEAASKFTKSVAEGNSMYAKELFTEDACLFGFLNGKLERGSIDQFYHNVDTVGAGEEFKTRIDVLELEETLAKANIVQGPAIYAREMDKAEQSLDKWLKDKGF